MDLSTVGETLLATVAGVNLNSATANTLYTVPASVNGIAVNGCVITKVVHRNASTSLTTASWSVGFNSASFNDVIADATHTELTGSTLYTRLVAKAGATRGVAGDVLKLLANTLQGGAATITVDIFGYLY